MLNAAARTMLQIHGVGIGEDLVHSSQGIDREALRSVIDAAFRGEPQSGQNFTIAAGPNESRVVKVQGMNDSASTAQADRVVLVFFDVSDDAAKLRDLEARSAKLAEEVENLTKRLTELTQRQRILTKANDDLTAANSELRTKNEQLLINSEESASAQEEIETLNEEMQATNEELETLNEELQATVEELNTTNDELQARTEELERTAVTREASFVRMAGQRDALVGALESGGELFAILDEEDKPIFVSRGLDGQPSLKDASKWDRDLSVELKDGRAVTPAVQELALYGKKLKVITFAVPPVRR